MKKRDKIESAYKEITTIGVFDVKEGNKPIDPADKIGMIPKKMYDHVQNGGKGCCFVFSSYLIKLLQDYEIESAMIVTKEGSGIRSSVMYEYAGLLYVANPVEDVEYFTENEYSVEQREKMYIGATLTKKDGTEFDASRIPLQEFANIYGDVWSLGVFKDADERTLNDAMNNKRLIARSINSR